MTTTTVRPFRFGFTGGASSKRQKLLDSARTVEALGYSTFGLPVAPVTRGFLNLLSPGPVTHIFAWAGSSVIPRGMSRSRCRSTPAVLRFGGRATAIRMRFRH